MRRSARDVLAGLVFVAFGVAFALGATTYEIGTPLRMGPGFFPFVIGGALAAIGGLIAIRPAEDGASEPLTAPPWRAVALILGALVVFGLTIRGLGLIPSVFVTCLLAALASRSLSVPKALALAVGLTVMSVLIFGVALSLRLPLLGPWIPRI